jgi:hypothetical protein|tara:strand:- start:1706 stop:2185 length:480 start_codon:yes stop_codon:yes gene_type:complete
MKIYKNYLPEPLFKQIQSITTSNTFPYFYNPYTANEKDKSSFLFTHLLFGEKKPLSNFLATLVYPLMAKIKYTELLRAKINLYTKTPAEIVTGFHTDSDKEHKVLLYSINTNNGYTLFKDGKKISSVANQAIVFDGKMSHSSVAQTDESIRVNININFI